MPLLLPLLCLALGYLLLSILAAGVAACIFGAPWRQLVRTRPDDLSPRARGLSFRSLDGLRLQAFFAPPSGDRPVLVFQSGRRGTRDHMLPWARILAAAGYGVFTFDWRAQGESEGRVLSYGAHGAEDLLGALEALEELPEARGREVGIYACSFGGACVAMAGGRLPAHVKGLVLDCPYGDLDRMAFGRLGIFGPLRWLPYWVLQLIGRVIIGRSPRLIRPEEELRGFAPRPVLVMHGDQDRMVPYSEGESLYRRYPGPKSFWRQRGRGHVCAHVEDTRAWMDKLARFFHQALAGAPPPEEVLARTPERVEEPTCWAEFRIRMEEAGSQLVEEVEVGREQLARELRVAQAQLLEEVEVAGERLAEELEGLDGSRPARAPQGRD